MLALYCKDAEEQGNDILTPSTIKAMDCSTSARLSDHSGSEHEENDDCAESVNEVDYDDSILAQSDNQNGINGENIEDDNGDEQ